MPSRSRAPLIVAALAVLVETSLACGADTDDSAERASPKSSEHEGTTTMLAPSTTACLSLLVGTRARVPVNVMRHSTINECIMPESGASLGCGSGPRRCVSSVNIEAAPVAVPIRGIDRVDCIGSSSADAGADAGADDDCEATFESGALIVSKASPGWARIIFSVLHEGELVRASSPLVITFSESPHCPSDSDGGPSPDASDGGPDAQQDASESDDASADAAE